MNLGGQSLPPRVSPGPVSRIAGAFSAEIRHPRYLAAEEIETWRRIQAQSPWLDSPFFSPEFTIAMGAARDDTRIAILERDGRIAGFFPFHSAARAIGKPVGGTFSDYQGPLLAPGTQISADELLKLCGLRAYDFNHCPAELAPLSAGGFIRSRSPRIQFETGYDAYVGGCTPTLKDAIRNTERRGRKIEREIGAVTYTFDDRSPEAWDWLVATKTRALAREGTKAGFEIPWIKALNAQLRAAQSPHFSGVLSTITCNGKYIAAHFGLRRENVLCWWHTTFDEELRQYAPGLMLLLTTIREGAGRGLTVIDLGRGNQHYKLVFSNAAVDLCEGAIARKGSVASALRAGQKLVTDAAARLPLGAYESLPRRAAARLISNVRLP